MERLVVAFECGAIVNPDGLDNQVEGAVVQGLGGALFEAVAFADGRLSNGSMAQYRVPRFTDVPAMDVSGLVALESAIARLQALGMLVVIAGAQGQPRMVMRRGGLEPVAGKLAFCATVPQAIELLKGPEATGAAAPAT